MWLVTEDEQIFQAGFSRRGFLATAGALGAGIAIAPLTGAAPQADAASVSVATGPSPHSPPVGGLHVQFGADASVAVVVSWHALQSVHRPRVLLGGPDGLFERSALAQVRSYVDAKSGPTVYALHAQVGGLRPDHDYVYAAVHEGAQAEYGSLRTAPRGRAPFTFTSFGDHCTPTTGGPVGPVRELHPAPATQRRLVAHP